MTPTRYFENVPSPGELVLSKEGGGWRHFLEGVPVEAGAALLMLTRSMPVSERTARMMSKPRVTLPVRYEMRVPVGGTRDGGPAVEALIVFEDGQRPATAEDRFEWPRRGGRR